MKLIEKMCDYDCRAFTGVLLGLIGAGFTIVNILLALANISSGNIITCCINAVLAVICYYLACMCFDVAIGE